MVFFWISIFLFCTPTIIIFLLLRTIWQLYTYWKVISDRTLIYDPINQPFYDMAIIVTGCDTGFGKDIAVKAADAGYTVFAGCYNNETSKKQFESFPCIISFQLDVTKDDDIQNANQMISEWLMYNDTTINNIPMKDDVGRRKRRVLHALINNAGIGKYGIFDWLKMEDYQSMMNVNFYGIIRMTKAFLPILKAQTIQKSYDGMRIINVTSMVGLLIATAGGSAYAASKFAAQAFTTSLRYELKPFHINVSSVNPSFHATPINSFLQNHYEELWNSQPKIIKEQYGKSCCERDKYLIDIMNKYSWSPEIVSEQIVDHCLRTKKPPLELLIGSDARFVLVIICMLPPYMRESIMNVYPTYPYPECMMQQ